MKPEKKMSLKRRIRKFFGLPDWEGYHKSMEGWYERERKLGMTLEEEAELRKKQKKIIENF